MHGPELAVPEWYAIEVAPQREQVACQMLDLRGVTAFYPKEDRVSFVRGEKVVRKFPAISRLIYAKFTQSPQWDILKARRFITGVVCYGNRPIVLPYGAIRALQGLPDVQDRLKQAREALMDLRKGDAATIPPGHPLSGFVVNVTERKGQRVWWEALIEGNHIRGEASADALEKQISPQDMADAEARVRAEFDRHEQPNAGQ
mgnify:CR=1 FL=1